MKLIEVKQAKKILEIKKETFDQKEVQKAFHRIAQKIHPDKHQNQKDFNYLFEKAIEARDSLVIWLQSHPVITPVFNSHQSDKHFSNYGFYYDQEKGFNQVAQKANNLAAIKNEISDLHFHFGQKILKSTTWIFLTLIFIILPIILIMIATVI